MTQEVGIVGVGTRAEMLSRLLSVSGRAAVAWPGPKGGMTHRQIKAAKARMRDLGVKMVTRPDLLAKRSRLILLALPAITMRDACVGLGDHLAGYHRLVHTMHGLEPETGRRGSEIIQQETPVRQVGAMVGPVFGAQHDDGQPNAAVIGSRFPALIAQMQSTLED